MANFVGIYYLFICDNWPMLLYQSAVFFGWADGGSGENLPRKSQKFFAYTLEYTALDPIQF